MALKLITPATELAVSLADAKLHVKQDATDDDTLIESWIITATEAAEQAMGRAIMPQTWQVTLDAFPGALELSRTPVASITSITYADATGTVQTLSPSLYSLDNADDHGPAYVVPAYGTSWPATRDQVNAVTCTYVAGWVDAASVPKPITSWIKLMIGALEANRALEGSVQNYSLGFADRLLDRYKIWSL